MTSIGSPSPFFLAGKKAHTVDRSLRFNAADSAYLKRDTAAGNRRKLTISLWVKRAKLTSQQILVNTGDDGGNQAGLQFLSGDTINFFTGPATGSGNPYFQLVTSAVFRDPSAWYHIVAVYDTENSTQADRTRLYVNGERITSFGTEQQPSQDYDTFWNQNGKGIALGIYEPNNSGLPFGGYMAEVNFVDGSALDQSYFGETDALTGQWNPKKYTGSYGTNGFYLNFSDNSGTTATTLGKDSSGNGNNFTPNNFSVSAGVGNDSITDTPTNNFATLNPLSLTGAGGTFSNGNLDFTADSNYATRTGNISLKTGKWYWEVIVTSLGGVDGDAHGIVQGSHPNGNIYPGYDPNGNVKGIGWYNGAGGLLYGSVPDGGTNGGTIGAGNSALSAYTTNDVLGFASDIANGTLAFYKNGTLEYTLTGIGSHDWFPAVCGYGTSSTKTINFGQLKASSTTYADANGHGSFKYSVPSGFLAMCTANLPDPTIKLPNKHFDTVLYTGDGNATGSQTDVLQFQPDWLWTKSRNAAYNHLLYDAIRGAGNSKGLNLGGGASPGTGAEGASADNATYGFLNSFDANGFSYTKGSATTTFFNQSSINYVVWNWNAGDTDGKTYVVKVHDFSGNNRYIFDDFQTQAVTLELAEGGTYIFNMDDASNASHPFMIGTTANDNTTAFGSGIVYKLDGVVKTFAQYHAGFAAATTRRLEFTIPASTNNLFYFCYVHSGMGGQINTNSTLGSSNFDGTLQATVKANPTAGFSIVTWTGNQTSGATLGHELGVAPKTLFVKRRDGTSNWICPLFDEQKAGQLNTATQFTNSYYNVFFTSQPSSTLLTIGSNDDINRNTSTYVAYVFSEVAGYSKIGRYYGNGSSDGVFVFTGFKVALLLVKRMTGSGNGWTIIDNKRDVDNSVTQQLYPASNTSEASYDGVDFLANGFKVRQTNAWINGTTDYYYLAFAESPFKNARAR